LNFVFFVGDVLSRVGFSFFSPGWKLSLFGENQEFQGHEETIAIAKTPGHRRKRKVIESLPLDCRVRL